MAETLESIIAWGDQTFGPCSQDRAIERAGEEWSEMEEDGADVPIEAADVIICLLRIPGILDAINRKMTINRGRTWDVRPDGTGYHVKAARCHCGACLLVPRRDIVGQESVGKALQALPRPFRPDRAAEAVPIRRRHHLSLSRHPGANPMTTPDSTARSDSALQGARKPDQHFTVKAVHHDHRFSVRDGFLALSKHEGIRGETWWTGDFLDPRGVVRVYRQKDFVRIDVVLNGTAHCRTWKRFWGDRTISRLARAFVTETIAKARGDGA